MEIGGRKLEDVEPDHRRARAAGIALRLVREQIDRLLV